MRRIFKTRYFSRWMRKTDLTDKALCAAIAEMMLGLIDGDLGGGIIKKRIGLAGRGKREARWCQNAGGEQQRKPVVFCIRIREKRPGQYFSG
jgi:hypothetical protein